MRWPYAVADDFFTKQLPNNVTWLLTLMYSLAQTGASVFLVVCNPHHSMHLYMMPLLCVCCETLPRCRTDM